MARKVRASPQIADRPGTVVRPGDMFCLLAASPRLQAEMGCSERQVSLGPTSLQSGGRKVDQTRMFAL